MNHTQHTPPRSCYVCHVLISKVRQASCARGSIIVHNDVHMYKKCAEVTALVLVFAGFQWGSVTLSSDIYLMLNTSVVDKSTFTDRDCIHVVTYSVHTYTCNSSSSA